MKTYAAFLRGVNVGGVNLKMADVSAALSSAGFTAVRTILASGNVVHNLRRIAWDQPETGFDWCHRFDEAAAAAVAH